MTVPHFHFQWELSQMEKERIHDFDTMKYPKKRILKGNEIYHRETSEGSREEKTLG